MPVPTSIVGDSTGGGTVVIQGCGNPCDPCGSGSGSGSGIETVSSPCCDLPVRTQLSVTVQDLGATTGLNPWFPAGTYGLKYETGGTFAPTCSPAWVWDGTGPITGLAECVGAIVTQGAGGAGGDSSYRVSPIDPAALGYSGCTHVADGTECTDAVHPHHAGPWVSLTFGCRCGGLGYPDPPGWQFAVTAHQWLNCPFFGDQFQASNGLYAGLFDATTGQPVDATSNLVSCDPFLLTVDLRSLDGTRHVRLTFTE